MIDTPTLTLLRDIIAAGLAAEASGAVAVPAGFKMEPIEQWAPRPDRLRGRFDTGSIVEFAAYIARQREHYADPPMVTIDRAGMTATAFHDYGTATVPGWCQHSAYLVLEPTAEYRAWQHVTRIAHNQQSMLDFIDDWAPMLAFHRDEDGGPQQAQLPDVIQSIRKLASRAVRDAEHGEDALGRTRGVLESARITSAPLTRMTAAIKCYEDLPMQVLRAALRYTPADPPTITPRWIGAEADRNRLALDFQTTLTAALDGLPVHVGTFQPKVIGA
jgi:uncharacterized protein YfdQ (DUF2303 family)